ncbi:MAG: hypothetical protein M1281_07755 [Chloroflexi bacterium]|nr:hypothetical protein [Chloroflexota bacterium]
MLRRSLIPLLMLSALLVSACVPAQTTSTASTPTVPQPQATATMPPATPAPTVQPSPSAQPTTAGSALTISVSPATASPGDQVTISGDLPGGPTQASAQDNQALLHANVCLDGCLSGLVIQGQAVNWSASQAGHFTIAFTLPTIPWLGESGPQPTIPGDLNVGVQCLGLDQQGCALQEATATATLSLQGALAKTCADNSCATLTLDPAQGDPGTIVQVTGWAPLDQIIGSLAFGYSLVLQPQAGQGQPVQLGSLTQQLDGSLSGSFQVPQSTPDLGTLQPGTYLISLEAARPKGNTPVLLAPATFQLGAALTWKALNLGKPALIQPSADILNPELAVDASRAGHLAYCAPGETRLTQDGGKTWTSVSTTGAAQAAQSAGYPLFDNGSGAPAACMTVTLDASHPNSFYALFQTAKADVGAPPVYFMGFFTSDGGKTWKLVPAPSPDAVERFGGFREVAGGVQALFMGESQQPDQAPVTLVEQSNDGGQTWSAAALTCPANGACLTWGSATGSVSGMGSPAPQWAMYSVDAGKTWDSTGQSVELRMTGLNELVTFADPTSALRLSGNADYPLLATRDGGKTWQALSLPALPNSPNATFPGLQMLPDGSLLAQTDLGQPWMELAPGASAWCQVSASLPTSASLLFQAAGSQLWFLPLPDNQNAAPQPQNVPLSSVKCKG